MKNEKMVCLGLMFFCATAFALDPHQTGKIVALQVHQDPSGSDRENQRFNVPLDGNTAGQNNCGSASWSGYLDTEAAKAQYSTLLALYLAGKEVQLQGTNGDTYLGNNVLIRNIYPVW